MDLVRCLRERSERYGDERWFAFVASRGGKLVETRRLTYAELDGRARALGARLAGRGARGEPVVLLHPTGPEFLVAFFGCLYAGAVAVPAPLPALDPRAFARAEGVLADTGARLVLTDAANLAMLDEWLARTGLRGRVRCAATDAPPTDAPPGDAAAGAVPPGRGGAGENDVAYLQYTSGSTSRPRGVMVTHGNVLANCAAITAGLGAAAGRAAAGWLPHFHDMGLVGMYLHALVAGRDLVAASPTAFLARPALWLEMIDRYRAGWTVAPDSGYEWLARRCRPEDARGLDVSCLRRAVVGAEPVRPATLDAVAGRFAAIGWDRRCWTPAYGLAEATLMVSMTAAGGPVAGRFGTAALQARRAVRADGADPCADPCTELVAAGRPSGAEVRIVDPETRAELGEGRVGEIWAAGAGVALGYRGDERATGRTFRARLRDGRGPFLRTGDLGFVLDGDLYVTGRLKEIVIVNGRNVHPYDLEEAGRRAHPAAGAGAAFAVRDGREHLVLVQEVRARNGEPLAEAARRIRRAASGAAGVPVSVVLVRRNGVPRTTSGKVQRARTRREWLGGRLTVLHADLAPDVGALLDRVSGT
ncbi:fatty acyl-AMP ligase [Actinomadura rifamycini]|uniref:fatty acyl-AMP ligase n=1 Tax=Actinomadura rifamycini TaxID=31962 RepID=UPI00040B5E57|nr:fatty acyl-AMP ligase [Actinomadura rifamycini]